MTFADLWPRLIEGAPERSRSFGILLKRDVNGNYPLPAGVRLRTAVWRNGLRQAPTLNYTIVADVAVPVVAFPWGPGDLILVDGE